MFYKARAAWETTRAKGRRTKSTPSFLKSVALSLREVRSL